MFAKQVHDYYYKPEPIFYGTGSRYLGVELEIDEGGESHENAGQILRLANSGDELVYCKHDGSLNEGFEIVTHPMRRLNMKPSTFYRKARQC